MASYWTTPAKENTGQNTWHSPAQADDHELGKRSTCPTAFY